MKTKLYSILLMCVLIPFAIEAQQHNVRDNTTQPNAYYLKLSETPNSLKLLPPPPDMKSAHFLYDKEQYEWGKSQRNTPRGELAVRDAKVVNAQGFAAFSEAFGIALTPENTPEICKLLSHMSQDAGDLGTLHAKEYYMHPRPYMVFHEGTSIPEDEASLSKNGSYPSGHTATGWSMALVLAEINPARQDDILKRGYEIGQSRVICGFHFQSDVDAGRLTASATVARLHANKAFAKQLAKAKKEFAKLQKRGAIKLD